jgi:hypothetical protein
MRALLVLAAAAACGRPDTIEPSRAVSISEHTETVLDPTPKGHRRMVPPEAYLRAYLSWFGGLSPTDLVQKARGRNLFDQWNQYLVALGLPDYAIDAPRATQSNTVMLAALGRLGEALCVRAAEHDLHDRRTPPDKRVVFAFDSIANPSRDDFTSRFDTLHRTFLSYPARLAPGERIDRFYALYRSVARRHPSGLLTSDETAWVAVCTALIQHPEAGLY